MDSGFGRVWTFRRCFGPLSVAGSDQEDSQVWNDLDRWRGGVAPVVGMRIHALFLSRSFLPRQGCCCRSGELAQILYLVISLILE